MEEYRLFKKYKQERDREYKDTKLMLETLYDLCRYKKFENYRMAYRIFKKNKDFYTKNGWRIEKITFLYWAFHKRKILRRTANIREEMGIKLIGLIFGISKLEKENCVG